MGKLKFRGGNLSGKKVRDGGACSSEFALAISEDPIDFLRF
jgi:hypothetical protein